MANVFGRDRHSVDAVYRAPFIQLVEFADHSGTDEHESNIALLHILDIQDARVPQNVMEDLELFVPAVNFVDYDQSVA